VGQDKVYALFPNLATMPDRPGGRMSGGGSNVDGRRTLMGSPYLVLLDERLEGVAPLIVEEMARMIVALKGEASRSALEQNLHFARLVSDRAVVLGKRGEVRRQRGRADARRDAAARTSVFPKGDRWPTPDASRHRRRHLPDLIVVDTPAARSRRQGTDDD
jgi:branched-chain amino acid transport system ATP-binding protein